MSTAFLDADPKHRQAAAMSEHSTYHDGIKLYVLCDYDGRSQGIHSHWASAMLPVSPDLHHALRQHLLHASCVMRLHLLA